MRTLRVDDDGRGMVLVPGWLVAVWVEPWQIVDWSRRYAVMARPVMGEAFSVAVFDGQEQAQRLVALIVAAIEQEERP